MTSSESEKEDKEAKEGTDKKEDEKKETEKKKEGRGKAAMKKGMASLTKSGDFLGRLGTLLVMLVSSTNTVTVMVTSFLEEVYWRGAIHAALLLFVHLPVLVVMIWLMCKARLMAIYKRVRPAGGKTPAVQEVVDEADKAKLEETKKEQLKKLNQLKKEKEEKVKKRAWQGQQINRAFEMA